MYFIYSDRGVVWGRIYSKNYTQKKEPYLMFDIFYTSKYDDKIAVITDKCTYTFSDIKRQIAFEVEFLNSGIDNVVILTENNFNFLIHFFAGIFSGKNIYILSDKNRLKNLDFEYVILDEVTGEGIDNYKFPEVDREKPLIRFYTSGSSSEPKMIKKSLDNLIFEVEDVKKEFDFGTQTYSVISTTSMCHSFGLTFHLLLPLYCGYTIDTRQVLCPEDIDSENTILISTPTFLNSIKRYSTLFKVPPELIFSAGSKLNENIFELLEEKSKVIEIYGSTETGVIAHKTHYNEPFVLFKNVEVDPNEKCANITSKYIFEGRIGINDRVDVTKRTLIIKSRTDRLFKIYEKRVSADELENNLRNNEFVKDCYITKHNDKLVCFCALSDVGKEYLLNRGVPNLNRALKQYLRQYSEIVPQRWKFIDALPMTMTGKVNKKLIEHIFNVNLSLPVILDRKIQGNSIDYKIFFYNRCNFFKGHFPQLKLLPGVVQLYLAREFANIHYNLTLGAGQWKKIKFSNIIEPDSVINLKLEKTEKHVSYTYYSDTKKYSSGMFLCENVFKELK